MSEHINQGSSIDPKPLKWEKSTFSAFNGSCVERAHLPEGGVAVRNSNEPSSQIVVFTDLEWRAFLSGVRAGELD
jgi:hypothetical protein